LLLTFGPGNHALSWTIDHLLIFQAPFHATLIFIAAGISLHTGRVRPLFAVALFVAFAILLTSLMV